MNLIIILAALLAFGILMYALLDGFDLGIGNMFLFFKKNDRGRLMDSIAPLWDGNETWLIYVGTIGVAAFPIVYYGILPSLYIPAILMVAGLFMRGLSFEFRLKAKDQDKVIWDFTFFLGSLITSFFQGVLFASAFVELNIKDGMYQGTPFDFISSFSIVSGILTVIVYCVLGLAFLKYKTEGEIANLSTSILRPLILLSLIGTFIMEYWLLHRHPGLFEHFISHKYKTTSYVILSGVSIIVAFFCIKSLKKSAHGISTFLLAGLLLSISLIKKIIIIWPFVIFPSYTIFEAANSPTSLKFTFVVICIFLPIVLSVTAFTYFTFRGKLKQHDFFYT